MLRRVLGVCVIVAGTVALAVALFFLLTVVYHVYVDRGELPDIERLARSAQTIRSVHFRTALRPG